MKMRQKQPKEKRAYKARSTQHTNHKKQAISQAKVGKPQGVVAASKSVPIKKTSTTAKKPAFKKKNVKMMSEKKFKALQFKMRLNITISQKEREIYQEQRVLRNLKNFLG